LERRLALQLHYNNHVHTIPTFQQAFNWPDAVIELGSDTTVLRHRLGEYLGDPERMHAMSRKNAAEALLHFDWDL
jgi:hypothetical protein